MKALYPLSLSTHFNELIQEYTEDIGLMILDVEIIPSFLSPTHFNKYRQIYIFSSTEVARVGILVS